MNVEQLNARCAAAEKALRRARTCLRLTPPRRQALAFLGELKAGQTAGTGAIARALHTDMNSAHRVLKELEEMGLVECAKAGGRGPGNEGKWKLGYLVEIPSEETP
jgi:DNA-binding MarR family transcriptional regulator